LTRHLSCDHHAAIENAAGRQDCVQRLDASADASHKQPATSSGNRQSRGDGDERPEWATGALRRRAEYEGKRGERKLNSYDTEIE
jgi:hypothetical protein